MIGRALPAALLGVLPALAMLPGCQCVRVSDDLLYPCESDGTCLNPEQECHPDGYCRRKQVEDDGGEDAGCGPQSCAQLNASCGWLTDNCGAEVYCGGCEAGTCGGAGVPYQCGPCDAGNPDPPDDAFMDTNCDGLDGEAASALFVDPAGGARQNDGSRESPLATFAQAVQRIRDGGWPAKNAIYLSEAEYRETGSSPLVEWPITIAGGYRPDAGWGRGNRPAVIWISRAGLTVQGGGWEPDAAVLLDRLVLEADDGRSPVLPDGGLFVSRTSSIGLRVESGAHVVLRHCAFSAGAGAAGPDGADGAAGSDGNPGDDGTAGGAGGLNRSCLEAGGGQGGTGGGATPCGNACSSCIAVDGAAGQDGEAGSDGDGGGGGAATTTWSNPGRSGQDGVGGSAGRGGGGGNAGAAAYCADGDFAAGGIGGGGGAGGCGGAGGLGGIGGGSSVGILLIAGSASLEDVVIRTKGGGAGGRGGSGGNGGAGGAVGSGEPGERHDGGPTAGNGGPGGRGGNGGRGGPGGGGGGGPSLGIWCVNDGGFRIAGTVRYLIGDGGTGGPSPGKPGADGPAEETVGCR